MQVKIVPGPASKILEIAIKDLQGKVGKVGWFEGLQYKEPPYLPVAYIAAIQEYGSPPQNIPPRPFMRPTIMAEEANWRAIAEQGVKAVFKGTATAAQVMEAIGNRAEADIRKTIYAIHTPLLSPVTIARRLERRGISHKIKKSKNGFYEYNVSGVGELTKPLIDTGYLQASLSHKVEDE